MAFWNRYPYTDMNQLNLDWILSKLGLVDKAKLDAEAAKDAAETAQAGAESSQAAAAASQEAAAESENAAEVAADRTQNLYDDLSGTVAPQVTAWLNENVDPVGSAVVVDASLSVAGAAADAAATGAIKGESSETINLIPARSRNGGTYSGVTITVNNDGSYTITGTAIADVRFDLYASDTNYPTWLNRNTNYYTVVYNRVNAEFTLFSIINGSTSTVITNPDKITTFKTPASGGIRVSIVCRNGRTFNETIRPVILAETETVKGAYGGLKSYPKIDKVINLLEEVNSITSNGVTLTNIGEGKYTLVGTATADTNFTFFTSTTDLPSWMTRGKEYYVISQGALSSRFIVTTRPGYSFLANVRNFINDFEAPSSGGLLIAVNIDTGMTYNETIEPVIIEKDYFTELYLPKQEVVVSHDNTGDFGTLKGAIEYSNKYAGTTIYVQPGTYDLVQEFGETYLDSLSENNPNYGLYLGNNVKIICSPRAFIYFDYDGQNEWVVRYFSPFNTLNTSYEVIGMNVVAHNCRYIVHDDPLWPDKMKFSRNVWKECYFEMFPSPQVASWVNHQIIGGGFGYNTLIEIDSCVFNDHYSGVTQYSSLSYHNDVSREAGAKSHLTVKNCYFADGNRIIIEGYGSATEKSIAVICGNSLKDATTDIIYDSSNADNIAVYRFNNESR